jgi:hypothetical protein
MKAAALLLTLTPLICAAAEPLLPTAEGTTWRYNFIQEKPSASFDLTEPNEQEEFVVTYRLGSTQSLENKELRRLEIYRGEALESVDLIAVEENGIVCPARADDRNGITKLNPPQKMVAMPLKTGTKWTFDGTVGETKVNQRYQIAGEEDVDVPAGRFHAWRIHCEQTLPTRATIDRWFVPGTGFVKVETTANGPSGGLLQKTSLKLIEPPKIVSMPEETSTSKREKLSAGVSSEPKGEFKTEFKSDTPALYVSWHSRGIADRAEIRAVFIADNVADVSAGYQIDQSTTTAPSPNSSGVFTLSKPEEGWTPGNYRIEFFVDDQLTQTLKFTISK